MDLREVEWRAMDWIDLAQDKNRCGNESSGSLNAGNFLINCGPVRF
jgi:hypothetical protein